MSDDLMAAMRRSLDATRAGDLSGATRLIRTALAGGASSASRDARPAVEDAEVVSDAPPRRARRPLGETLRDLGARDGRGTSGAPALPEGARWERRRHAGPHGAREYRLFVPAAVAAGEAPVGLVVMLHGCTQGPEDFARGTGMNAQGERHRLLVAWPAQDRNANMQGCWNWFRPEDQGTGGEPGVIAGIAREVSGEFGLAEGRAFVAGLSAGGAMAAVAAARFPDAFAAAGVHSGLRVGAATDVASAFAAMGQGAGGAAPVVPTILFHGDADRTVAPGNADHAERGLRAAALHEGEAGGRRVRVVSGRTAAGHAVELWRVAGAGHAWQGGDPAGSYADAEGPDASAEMARFFLARLG